MLIRQPVFILSLALLTVMVNGCAGHRSVSADHLQRFEYTRLCMGVNTRIVLFSPDDTGAIDAAAMAFDRIGHLDAVMSDYRRDSELNRLCERAGDGPVKVSDDLFEVLRQSRAVSRASEGAFDPTAGPLVALWRKARQDHALPDVNELAAARERVGWRNIQLHERDHTVTLLKPRLQLDLGGIGKGYAAQQAVDLLKARGVNRCMVALAGDIAVGDAPPDANGWRIEIASRSEAGLPLPGRERVGVRVEPHDPQHVNDTSEAIQVSTSRDQQGLTNGPTLTPALTLSGRGSFASTNLEFLLLTNAAVSTAGDASQFLEINSVRYSHIIDPFTGMGLTNQVQVTVIAPRGEIADALSSAASVIGTTEGITHLIYQFSGTAAIIDHPGTVVPTVIDPSPRVHWAAEGAQP